MFGLSGGASDTVFTGFRQSILKKKLFITPVVGCQAGSQNLIAKRRGFWYLKWLSRTRSDRGGHRPIDES
jgi:hypothetical protein